MHRPEFRGGWVIPYFHRSGASFVALLCVAFFQESVDAFVGVVGVEQLNEALAGTLDQATPGHLSVPHSKQERVGRVRQPIFCWLLPYFTLEHRRHQEEGHALGAAVEYIVVAVALGVAARHPSDA